MKYRIYKTISNEEGSISIWFAILGLIMITIVASLLGNFKTLRAISEIQGTIDVAGVSALRVGVDENAWRDEELVVDRSTIINTFYDLIDKERLKASIGAKDLRMEHKIVTRKSSNFADGKERAEVYLITDTYITIPASYALDQSTLTKLDYYDFFSNRKDSISITGTKEDGWQELLVRSTSRLVLR